MFYDSESGFADSIIASFKSMSGVEEQLKYTIVLLYQLPVQQQEDFREYLLEFEKIFENIEFMRKIRYRDSLVRDYSSEYFGKDYLPDDPFLFDRELEKRINAVTMKIMACLGMVVKSLKDNEMIISDDM